MHKLNVDTFDLNLLAVFLKLWETRSVTRASDKLALSQPAVSHALRHLRDALGDELFVSGRDGLVPTARAEALLAPVRQALTQMAWRYRRAKPSCLRWRSASSASPEVIWWSSRSRRN